MKKAIWVIIIILIVGGVWFAVNNKQAKAPAENDKEVSVDAELNGLSDTDLEAEFSEIDADAQQL